MDKRAGSNTPPLADNAVYTVGRARECDIVLDDPFVSLVHVKVVAHPGRLQMLDLGSKNGTYVNRKKVKEAWLRDGDVLRMGDTKLQVSCAPLPGDPTPTRDTPQTITYKFRDASRSETGAAVLKLHHKYGDRLGDMQRKVLDEELAHLLRLSPHRARRRFDELYVEELSLNGGARGAQRYAVAAMTLAGH